MTFSLLHYDEGATNKSKAKANDSDCCSRRICSLIALREVRGKDQVSLLPVGVPEAKEKKTELESLCREANRQFRNFFLFLFFHKMSWEKSQEKNGNEKLLLFFFLVCMFDFDWTCTRLSGRLRQSEFRHVLSFLFFSILLYFAP